MAEVERQPLEDEQQNAPRPRDHEVMVCSPVRANENLVLRAPCFLFFSSSSSVSSAIPVDSSSISSLGKVIPPSLYFYDIPRSIWNCFFDLPLRRVLRRASSSDKGPVRRQWWILPDTVHLDTSREISFLIVLISRCLDPNVRCLHHLLHGYVYSVR